MGWRSVVVSKGATLRFGGHRLVIEQAESATVPLEDIAVLVLDSAEILLTSRLLSECAEAGITVLTVGRNHLPNGALLPFLPHSRSGKTLQRQLKVSLPAKKRAWQRIVQRKILNQGACLDLSGKEEGDRLAQLAGAVRSGDPDNQEAVAAQRYFRAMFGPQFHRARPILVNAALNYGYAVLRAAIGRTLASYGFVPALGLHHRSEQNAFNLADDWIEPFRPLVDLSVASCDWGEEERDLQPKDKAQLVSLLHHDIALGEEIQSVLAAIDLGVQSLGRFYEAGDPALLRLPVLLPLRLHDHE
jgi:CRISPR-associated protein Cas1